MLTVAHLHSCSPALFFTCTVAHLYCCSLLLTCTVALVRRTREVAHTERDYQGYNVQHSSPDQVVDVVRTVHSYRGVF